jgi:hypothetical protein
MLAGMADSDKPDTQRETFRAKVSRLSDSNAFWSGGAAMILAALGLISTHIVASLIMIIIGWLIVSVSIYRINFFDSHSKLIQIIGHFVVIIGLAGILAWIWVGLRPDPEQTAIWQYVRQAAVWIYPYTIGFLIACGLLTIGKLFRRTEITPQYQQADNLSPIVFPSIEEFVDNIAGPEPNITCVGVRSIQIDESDARARSQYGSHILVAEFANDVDPDKPTQAITQVYSRIIYYSDGIDPIRINKGFWRDQLFPGASFHEGDAQQLILASRWSDSEILALGNNNSFGYSNAKPTKIPLIKDRYRIAVRLYGKYIPKRMIKDFEFLMILKPELSIRLISDTSLGQDKTALETREEYGAEIARLKKSLLDVDILFRDRDSRLNDLKEKYGWLHEMADKQVKGTSSLLETKAYFCYYTAENHLPRFIFGIDIIINLFLTLLLKMRWTAMFILADMNCAEAKK